MKSFDNVSPEGLELIRMLREQQKADPRRAVSIPDACLISGLKETTIREYIAADRFASFTDGVMRRVLVASIYDWLIERVTVSYPADGKRPRVPRFLHRA